MNDRITLRFLAAPQDATRSGTTVQAGRVLEWIDKAGYACAAGYSGRYCVTAYVGNVHFTRAIRPGDLVEASARIIHTGRSSMQVLVTVESADPRVGEFSLATDCLLIFVATDDERHPVPVPPWRPRTAEDEQLSAGAETRIAARAQIRDLTRGQVYSAEGTTLQETFRFLAAPTDINWGGNVHGGNVMRWIDEVASTVATRWSGRESVAVYTGGIHFYRPMQIGHVVELDARLIHTGRHSMHIAVHVRSGDPRGQERLLTTQCMTIFVAPNEEGRASEVRALELRSEEDRRLDAHARELIELRRALPPQPLPRAALLTATR